MKFIVRWIVTAIAAAAAIKLVPGISIAGTDEALSAIIFFALSLSLVDTIIKPIFKVLSLPITFLTLGVFYLFINTIMIYLAAYLSASLFGSGIAIASFGSAFFASIVISVVSSIMNAIFGKD